MFNISSITWACAEFKLTDLNADIFLPARNAAHLQATLQPTPIPACSVLYESLDAAAALPAFGFPHICVEGWRGARTKTCCQIYTTADGNNLLWWLWQIGVRWRWNSLTLTRQTHADCICASEFLVCLAHHPVHCAAHMYACPGWWESRCWGWERTL